MLCCIFSENEVFLLTYAADIVDVVECCRDKVVSRFERCRVQFADACDLWLAAESSVQLLAQTVGDVTHATSADESGIGSSTLYHSLPPMRSPQLSKATTTARDTGICSSTADTAETSEKSEMPEVKLERLKRLKKHLTKFFQRFNPHDILTHHQCTCEAEKW